MSSSIRVALVIRKPSYYGKSIEMICDTLESEYDRREVQFTRVVVPLKNGLLGILLNPFYVAIRTIGYDVVHNLGDSYYATILCRNVLITFHDFNFLKKKYRYLGIVKLFLLKLIYVTIPIRRAKKITVISRATSVELLNINRKYLCTIVNNPLPKFSRESTKLFDLPEQFVLLIGTKPNKNVHFVLSSLEGKEKNVVIVGNPKEVKSLPRSLNVKFYSNLSREELAFLYQSAKCLCFLSLSEGFGLPILEAQYWNCPVITSNKPPMSDVSGGAAILVNPTSESQLHLALDKLSDYRLRESLKENGKQNLLKYSSINVCDRYLQVYSRLLCD